METRKIALVTGANRGIGFEIARQLAQKGVIVVLAARRLPDAEHAASKLHTDAMPVYPVKLDVTNSKDIADVAHFIGVKFGHLDILVNNAGVNLEAGKNTDVDTFRQVFETNTVAQYAITKAMLPLIEKSSSGRIVNQSSVLGSISGHAAEDMGEWAYMGYCSSKAALNMMTVIWAHRLKEKNIKINAAHPGWVRTRMGGEEAPLSPSDGAKTAIRLALLPDDGPTGGFFHNDDTIAW